MVALRVTVVVVMTVWVVDKVEVAVAVVAAPEVSEALVEPVAQLGEPVATAGPSRLLLVRVSQMSHLQPTLAYTHTLI